MSTSDSREPAFWDERYQTEKTPWDFHGVPLSLRRWLQANTQPKRVLIPGCGSGYEIKAFLDAGWDAYGIDFSPVAVQRAQTFLGEQAHHVLLGDFYHYAFKDKFDVIYERTFLCALPPDRWVAYAQRIKELLVPGGQLIGFFFYGLEDDPPPYPLTRVRADELFGPELTLTQDEAVTDSLPLFVGKERWQIWKNRKETAKL